ncbi:MAG: ATP-binding protein, partial [Gammaproteobacteria bacterium]|nr:ATP-binding protein [Gammaproteobacteria bacterium]
PRRDLLEIMDDRCNAKSTLIASQLPIDHWHDYIDDPTLADAILDRLVHNAYRLQLSGGSMRKRQAIPRGEKAVLDPSAESSVTA